MSQFLPEGQSQSQPSSGVADITPASPETTSADIALMQRVFSAASRNPNLIPQDFMAYMLDWIQTQRLTIPIGQVFGFSQFTAQYARVDTSESTTSTSYADLATAGPQVTGLSAGRYVLLYGAVAQISSSVDTALLAPSIAGVAPVSNGIAAWTGSTVPASIMSASLATLTAPGDVKIEYAVTPAGTGTFQDRWLIALRYASA